MSGKADLGIGTAVRIRGAWQESPARGQDFEIIPEEIEIVGPGNPTDYPIQKKLLGGPHTAASHAVAALDAEEQDDSEE